MNENPEYKDAKGHVLICEPDAYSCINVEPPPLPRSKLHHLVCTVGVERETPVKVRSTLTVEELEAINKRDARVIAKPS